MRNILQLMARSWTRRPDTLRFPARDAPAPRYRGAVQLDPSKCVACGLCDVVCVSGAIAVRAADDHLVWDYDAGRCTFCGRCVDHCRGGALSQAVDRPPVYRRLGALREVHTVPYPACPRCGRPARPVNDRLLRAAFDAVPEQVRERARLCDRCRTVAAQADLRHGTAPDPGRNDDAR
jgi:Fe-S-cluster-containing hydrogenase component 2